jgi:hypothetical protein
MGWRHGIVALACLIGVLTGPWSHSEAQAQQAPSGITREGTIVSINRAASSFVMSAVSGNPRQITVLAQRFTQIYYREQIMLDARDPLSGAFVKTRV